MTMTNLDKIRTELKALVSLGREMYAELCSRRPRSSSSGLNSDQIKLAREKSGKFEETYQSWFTEAAAVVKQLIPERLAEFRQLYEADPKRKEIHAVTFAIQDWLNGLRAGSSIMGEKYFDDHAAAAMRFSSQLGILGAAERRFDSRLMDLEQIVRADLFDTEIAKARDLLKSGYDRPSGVIAGVVLEEHLQTVCSKRSLRLAKKSPTISDLNDVLRNEGVIDTVVWRFVQRLGDIRNLCGHKKDRDPTRDEVQELIDGTDKITKTVG
jgi:hypothetical protein